MRRRPPRSTRTHTLFPDTTLFRAGSRHATGLRKTYGKRTVVHDGSLSVDSGEVVGLLGPNGAGKTTSFYMIVGIVPTDAGRIEIDDTPITSMPRSEERRVGKECGSTCSSRWSPDP